MHFISPSNSALSRKQELTASPKEYILLKAKASIRQYWELYEAFSYVDMRTN
ncbi:MAG: hypothetical protein PHI36_06090 [Bacteroidales bacterium]|nr:hypothetical protein [Bacteroidales bacterium]MDD4575980.1 hypothetical protein [Bacteroidales bacterium]